MRFGIFLAPFHRADENPTLALERDLELVEALDRFGYDEAWFGEHHSAGAEIIASPEVFIAAAAARTKHIRLGTGVSSLPYHHPLLLADRMVLLDHLTRGRAMLGVGPGALPSDAAMMGIDPMRQRDMMEESLDAIIALLTTDEPVTRETDWFTLKDARLHLRPYTQPRFEIAVAAIASASGPRLAAKFGCGLLSIAATTIEGFTALGNHWTVMEEQAARSGTTVDRSQWRLVGPMHIADSVEQAKEDVRFGLERWIQYITKVAALPILPPEVADLDLDTIVDMFNGIGISAVGTPDMAADAIARLEKQSGGFGTYLFTAHEWADREATLRSYELFARYVAPRFQGQLDAQMTSRDIVAARNDQMRKVQMDAQDAATAKYVAERDAAKKK
ncbi:MAG: LLM class flavin-dependent oxidoreductase [Actinomycetota bacterium]